MYNSGRRGKRAPDGYGVISVNEKFNQTSYPIPIIDSWSITDGSYNPINDTALDTAGGQTIVLYGSGFASGATVNINGSNIGIVTVLDSNRITFTSPALSAASYTIYVSNTDGATAIYVPGLVYSGLPTWSSPASGTIGTSYETKNASTLSYTTFTATGDATITYSIISGNLPSGVTLSSSGELSGTLPATSSPTTYSFTIRASDGQNQDSDRAFSLTINPDAVTWVTPSLNGSYSVYETQSFSTPLNATSAAGYGVMYSADTLPTGVTLNPSTGALNGYANTVGNTNAQLTATANTTGRYTTSNVTFTVNQDVVTWSSPANNTDYALPQDVAMSDVTLLASSAAGYGVQYTANALPTGVTLSGGTISGTPNTAQTVYTQLTATSNTTNRVAYRYISWTVSIASDTYWKNATMLLSANSASQTPSFIADMSPTAAQFVLTGDTRPSNSNPFQPGYYSVQYTGTVNDYISIPHNSKLSIMSGDTNTYVAECFVYWNVVNASMSIMDKSGRNTISFENWSVRLDASKQFQLIWGASGTPGTSAIGTLSTTTIPVAGKWYHVAFVKSNADWALFVNGTRITSFNGLNTANDANPAALRIGLGIGGEGGAGYMNGYISNVRVYNGPAANAPYSATSTTLTVPTTPATPFTDAANTGVITCNSERFKDTSSYNATITGGSTVKINSTHPYTNAPVTTYGSAYFDGTGDNINAPNSPNYTFGTGDFTIECWFYSTSATAAIFDLRNAISQVAPYLFMLTSTLRWYVSGGYQITSGTVTLNTWNHVAVVRSSGVTKMYLNGVQTGSSYTDTNSYLSNPVYVGGAYNSSQMTTGYISNLRVIKGQALYTGTFTPATNTLTSTGVGTSGANVASSITGTVSLLTLQTNNAANSGVFLDSSNFSSNTNINRTGNVNNGTFSPYGDNWSVYVPTGNPVMNTADSANLVLGTGDWTIEAWINLSTVPGAAQAFYIFSNRRLNNASWTDGPMACITNSKLYARDANGGFLSTTPTTFVAGKWYHIAVCRSGNSIYCFIDGVQEGTAYNISIGGTYAGNSIRVGYEQQFGTTASDGYVSNLRVIKGQALYTTNFTPSTTPLVATATTQALICNDNRAKDSSFNNLTVTKPDSIIVQKFSPFSTVTIPKYYSTFFDGTGDYIQLAEPTNVASGVDVTAECWCLPTNIPSRGFVFNAGASSLGAWGLSLTTANTVEVWSNTFSAAKWTSTLTVNRNQWNHLALVKSSGVLYLYVNGVRDSGSYTHTTVFGSPSVQTITLGAYNIAFNQAMYGYISNFRYVQGTALYTGATATIPTSTLTSISGTVALTCQDNIQKDNSNNKATITSFGDAKSIPISPFTPTANTGVVYSPAVFGGSMYFDGTGDYLSTPYNAIHDINSGDFTVEAWVYRNVTGAEHNIFVTRSSAGTDGWNLRINLDNTLQFYFTGGGTQTSTGTIPAGAWTHVAASKIGTTLKLFINGILDGTNAAIGTGTVNTAATLRIGVDNSSAAGYMNGYISDARITKGQALYTSNFYPGATPLTPIAYVNGKTDLANTGSAAILLSGATGGIIEQTRTVNLESFGDAKTVDGVGPYNGSYYSCEFPNSLNYCRVAAPGTPLSLTGDFTVEFWLRVNSFPSVYSQILSQSGGNSDSLKIDGTGGTGYFYFYNGTSYNYSSAGSILPGKWYHVVWERSGTTSRMYLNGVGQTAVTTFTSTVNWNVDLYVSASSAGGEVFYGNMSNLRIIKGTCLYDITQNTLSVPTSPLTAVSGTQLLTFQNNKLVDNSTNLFSITTGGTQKVATQNPFQVNSGRSYYFDGTGDYLTTHTGNGTINFGLGDFTIETWVYFSASNATYNPFIRVNGGSQLDFGFDFSVNQLKYSTSVAVLANSWTPKVGQWYHIALVRSSGVAKIYVDGTNISGSGAVDSFNHSLNSYSTYYRIGGSDFSATHVMYGYLTDFRITKGVARTITVPTTPLILK